MKQVYSLRDTKSGVYGQPTYHVNEQTAIRSLGDLVNEEPATSTVSVHPGDFDLYFLGQWDELDGNFVFNDDSPRHVVNCANLVKTS